MALANHKPAGQHVVLQAVKDSNPARRDGAWTESEVAKQCTVLTGQPCLRQSAGKALRDKLLPKGLVKRHREGKALALWWATEEARVRAG